MRIIESCGQCRHMRNNWDNSIFSVSCSRVDNAPTVIDAIPDFCPLPKVDDKLREAWIASREMVQIHMAGDGEYKHRDYDEWKEKRNG